MSFSNKLKLYSVLTLILSVIYQLVIKTDSDSNWFLALLKCQNLLFFGITAVLLSAIHELFFISEPELPKSEDQWFGKNKINKGDLLPSELTEISKFEINIHDEVLEDLKSRLKTSRFVEPIEGNNFNYGFNGNYLRQVIDYWITKYDWCKAEKQLNQYNHYKTQIEGLKIHFIHVKPTKSVKKVVPILIIHGWPGSVWEYYKSFPLLIEPNNDIAFEVICPSIPGYGFSEAPHQEGFNVISTARIFVKLMKRLNHEKFFVHGGDWGSFISKTIALLYPENVIGIHTTLNTIRGIRGTALIRYFIGKYFPSLIFDNPKEDYKNVYSENMMTWKESGYSHIQATKPDTVGAALIDSPVGLAAYILEKYSTWTDPNNLNKSDGGLTQKYTLDELLTQIMIYWVSNNVASSMRFYKENWTKTLVLMGAAVKESVPAAVADFPNELIRVPKVFLHYGYKNLVQFSVMPRGGHFAAFEEPELVSNDLKKFAKTVLQNSV